MLTVVVTAASQQMPVDHENVRRIVAQAITDAADDGTCCGRVGAAFRALQARRQVPGGSLDLDLAAAEHYIFARWMVCLGQVGTFQMRLLVRGYDAKKRLDGLLGDPNAEQVTDNPVSPPDDDVRAWGLRGVTDGETDRDRCNAGSNPPLWRPLEEVFGPGRGVGPY